MKANVLRMPLIKAAGILFIFSLLVYFTSTDPEATIWTSLGTIIVAGFTTVQWLVAMSLALVFSIAFLIGVFLGAVAVFNPGTSSRMYEGLRLRLIGWLAPINELWTNTFKSDNSEQLAALTALSEDLKTEIGTDIRAGQAGLQKLEKMQNDLIARIDTLTARLTTLEEATAELATNQQVEELGEELKTVVDSTAGMREVVDSLQKKVTETSSEVAAISPETILGDLPGRLEALEQEKPEQPAAVDLAPMEKKISEIQAEVASLKMNSTVPAAAPAEKEKDESEPENTAEAGDEGHRIFSYFDSQEDKTKVAELVASTLKKDMSYKQVMDLVAKGLGSNGKIITSHPSLSKDYIRQCRRNS